MNLVTKNKSEKTTTNQKMTNNEMNWTKETKHLNFHKQFF